MEHINVIIIDEVRVKLTPDNGYILYNTLTRAEYSEAIINKDRQKFFIAIEK